MSIYAFLSLLAAVTTFSLGLLVYLNSSKGKLTSIFLFFAVTVSILSISQFQMRIAANMDEAYLWSKLSSIWPFTLVLAIHFILELNRKKDHHFLLYFLLYFPALIFSYVQFSTHLIALPPIEKYWGWSIEYNDGSLFMQIITITYLVSYWLIVLSLLFIYYKKFVGKAKTQILYIYIGFLLNFIISVTSDIVFPLLKIDIPELGSVSDILTFSLIAFGIWRYDLFRLGEDGLSSKLFSSISNYLVLVDGNKNILEINKKLLDRLSFTYDEVYGQNISNLLAPKQQDLNPLSLHIERYSTFENKKILFKAKDGNSIPLTFTASYVKLDENLKPGLIYVGTENGLGKQVENSHFEVDKETNFLAEATLDLVKCTKTNEIHEYITEKIYTLLQGKAYVVCTEMTQTTEYIKWHIKNIKGIHTKIDELFSVLGFDINTYRGHTKTSNIIHLEEGKLNLIDLNISELTNYTIPNSVSEKAIKLLGIREMNIIPILHENKISGTISILTKEDTPVINIELVESFVAIASMVLKRKYYENELAELNNMQNKLFSVIGHDLKSPLSNVLSYTDMILSDYDSFSKDDLREFLQSIQRSANTGFDILNSLLLWSKSVQGGLPLKPELINIKEIVSEAIDQVLPLAVKKEITVSNKIDKNIFISADKNMTITVFRNLLSNAIKFTNPSGHIDFDSNIQKISTCISVTDDGVGMNPAQLGNLFKLDKLNIGRGTAGEKGSGFGLLICKDFVEKNGGRIKVESKLNEGSVFTLIFPLVNGIN